MWTRLRHQLLFLVRGRAMRRELDEEFAFHRAMLERDHMNDGLDASAATAAARRRLGNTISAHEASRDSWVVRWIDTLARDLWLALRSLRRSPAFALAAIATLALGIGANLAIFRFVDAALFETLPVPHPDELVLVTPGIWSYPTFRQLADGTTDVFAGVAAYTSAPVNVGLGDASEYLSAELVSGSYFETLQLRPVLGRLLNRQDDGTEGGHPVCVISESLWRRRFNADPSVLTRPVTINSHPFQIVGVTERGYDGVALHSRYDIQVPLSMTSSLRAGSTRDSADFWWLRTFARLRPGVSAAQAEAAVRARFEQPNLHRPLSLSDGRQGFGRLREEFETPALIAQTLSACVFLIACANLIGLLLSRTSARRHELAVRQSLGASRRRIVTQVVVEAGMLAGLAGLAGAAVSLALDRALLAMLTGPDSTMLLPVAPSVREFGVGVGLVALVVCAVGLLPALVVTRQLPLHDLRNSSRMSAATGTLGRAVVVLQIVVCLVLVFGAGLLRRTLHNLRGVELGHHASAVVVMTANPVRSGYTRPRAAEFHAEWLRRIRLIPGVASASLSTITVMSQGMMAANVTVPGAAPHSGHEPNNNFTTVASDYFKTIGMPLVAGREFAEEDTAGSERVVVVNQRFVDYYWPGQRAIGRTFAAMDREVTVVGVVGNAKYRSLQEEPEIMIYRAFSQQPAGEMTLHVRLANGATLDAGALVAAARSIDPVVPIYAIGTVGAYVDAQLGNERILNLLSTLFASLALVVAAAGIYGLVAYAVARRTREVGIRMAIGAQRSDVLGLFLREAVALVVVGVVVGLPLALMAGRKAGSVLYGVEPTDVASLVQAATILATVAVMAALIPTWRATRLNPTVTLRDQ